MSTSAHQVAALETLRATREYKRQAMLLDPITEALQYLLAAPPLEPLTQTPEAPAQDEEEAASDIPEETAHVEPAPVAAWTVIQEPAAPPPEPTRGERLEEANTALTKAFRTRQGTATARSRARRIMANSGLRPASRRSLASADTVSALKEVGKTGKPASFQVNLYV